MQSSDIFTVGGSIAVNAHGMDHNAGSVGRTIRAMRVMMSDGMIKNVSRTENAELFHLIIGGYGLFGIVLDVVIEITENVIYKTSRRYIDYRDFGAIFEKELKLNPALGLFYGHLSTSPQSLLREMILYLYEQQPILPAESVEIPALSDVSGEKLRRFTLNFAKLGSIPMQIKWFAEKYIEPRMESCLVKPRAQAMTEGEACLVTRNEPMHDSVGYLRNAIPNETDVLHEYFIPRNQFLTFVDGLREIVQKHTVNLLNASVRVVHKEDNMLNYAPQDAFSIVLYINQKTDTDAIDQMKTVTQELIDLCASVGGRFFLPYQLHYTPAQLTRSYPMIHTFFTKKLVYDPIGLFTNTFYEKYSNALGTA
jgi:FAD/FMN-containing dehydrogenase